MRHVTRIELSALIGHGCGRVETKIDEEVSVTMSFNGSENIEVLPDSGTKSAYSSALQYHLDAYKCTDLHAGRTWVNMDRACRLIGNGTSAHVHGT